MSSLLFACGQLEVRFAIERAGTASILLLTRTAPDTDATAALAAEPSFTNMTSERRIEMAITLYAISRCWFLPPASAEVLPPSGPST